MPPIRTNTQNPADDGWAVPPERNRWRVSDLRTVLPGDENVAVAPALYTDALSGEARDDEIRVHPSGFGSNKDKGKGREEEEHEDEDESISLAERITARLYEWGWQYDENEAGRLVRVVDRQDRFLDAVEARVARIEEGEYYSSIVCVVFTHAKHRPIDHIAYMQQPFWPSRPKEELTPAEHERRMAYASQIEKARELLKASKLAMEEAAAEKARAVRTPIKTGSPKGRTPSSSRPRSTITRDTTPVSTISTRSITRESPRTPISRQKRRVYSSPLTPPSASVSPPRMRSSSRKSGSVIKGGKRGGEDWLTGPGVPGRPVRNYRDLFH